MSIANALRTLETDFNTRWANETPIGFTNTPFYAEGLNEWTQFSVNFTYATQMSLGASQSQQRQHGFIKIQFYVPLKRGLNRANALVDKAVSLLSGVQVGTIRVHPPNVNYLGESEQWFVSNATFDFDYDYTILGR